MYDWQRIGTHNFLGCHTIYMRDYKDLQDTTGKWVELWVVLKKRTSADKVSGKLHLGIKVVDTGDDEIIPIKKPLGPTKVEATADPKKTKLAGQGLIDGKPKVDQGISFVITPCRNDGTLIKDSDDDWKVEISAPSGQEVPVGMTKGEDGSYEVQFKPLEPGNHQVNVYLNGKPISEATFNVNVNTEVDSDFSELFGMPMDPFAVNLQNKPIKITLQAKDKLGNPISRGGDKVNCNFGKQKGRALVLDNQDGTYDITFVPTEPGKCDIDVSINDKPMKSCTIDILPKAEATKCKWKDDETSVLVFTPCERNLEVRDERGNTIKRGGEQFEVKVTDPKGKEVDAYIRDNQDGTYTTVFVPITPGKHEVQLELDEKKVPKLFVKAHKEPDQNLSEIKGDTEGEVGEEFEFTLVARDSEGNFIGEGGDPFSCETDFKEEQIPVDFKDNKDGTYTAKFRPKRAGEHNVKFKLNGANVRPLKVNVHGGMDPIKSKLTGPGLNKCYKKIPARVFFKAYDSDGNEVPNEAKNLDLEVLDHLDQNILTKKGLSKEGKDQCMYIPENEGLHQLELKYKDQGIKKYYVIAEPTENAPDPNQSEIDGPKELVVGEPNVFEITLKDKDGKQLKSGDDDVEVFILGPGNLPIRDFDLYDLNNGKYKVEWTPKAPGDYKMEFNVLGNNIKGSPFDVKVIEGRDLSKAGIISRAIDFKLCDSKGNPIKPSFLADDDVEISIETEKGEKTRNVVWSKKYLDDGVYRLNLVVLQPGVYMVQICVLGETIPGCPIKLSVNNK